jgi:hypothetical protein
MSSQSGPNLRSRRPLVAAAVVSSLLLFALLLRLSNPAPINNNGRAAPDSTATTASQTDGPWTLLTSQSSRSSSAAHCSISSLTDNAWRTTACWYTNLCFDLQARDFVFFNDIKGARLPFNVTLDHARPYVPRVIHEPLPLPRLEAEDADTIFIPYVPSTPELEHVVRDELFAWWLLAANSPWEAYAGVQPLHVGSRRAGSQTQLALADAWAQALVDTVPWSAQHHLPAFAQGDAARFLCFPRAAMGLGAFTDHCDVPSHTFAQVQTRSSFRERRFPCAFGRGPLYWRMRLDILTKLGVPDSPAADGGRLVVLDLDQAEAGQAFWTAVLAKLQDVRVQVVRLAELSLQGQASVVSRANVLVFEPTGPGSAAVHFMPRHSAALALAKDDTAFPNFGILNGLGYIRPMFVRAKNVDEMAGQILFQFDVSERLGRIV